MIYPKFKVVCLQHTAVTSCFVCHNRVNGSSVKLVCYKSQIWTVLARKQQTLRKQEMDAILLRQQQLEETNRQLCEKAGELRRSLRDLDISQDRFQELRDLPEDKMSIQEYVAVSMRMLSLVSMSPETQDMRQSLWKLLWLFVHV